MDVCDRCHKEPEGELKQQVGERLCSACLEQVGLKQELKKGTEVETTYRLTQIYPWNMALIWGGRQSPSSLLRHRCTFV